jgi:hypothetical protein
MVPPFQQTYRDLQTDLSVCDPNPTLCVSYPKVISAAADLYFTASPKLLSLLVGTKPGERGKIMR